MELEFIIKAETKEPDETNNELKHGAKYHAERDAHDSAFENLPAEDVDAAGEPNDADQDADIIKGRGESVKDESTESLLDAGEDSGDRKEEGVDSDDAHHVDSEDGAGFVEAGADNVADERIGKNHN